MIRPAVAVAIPAAVAIAVAAGFGSVVAAAGFRAWWVASIVATSLLFGLWTSWRLGRRGAREIEDAIGWAIASAMGAFFAPLVLLVIVFAALGGGH